MVQHTVITVHVNYLCSLCINKQTKRLFWLLNRCNAATSHFLRSRWWQLILLHTQNTEHRPRSSIQGEGGGLCNMYIIALEILLKIGLDPCSYPWLCYLVITPMLLNFNSTSSYGSIIASWYACMPLHSLTCETLSCAPL